MSDNIDRLRVHPWTATPGDVARLLDRIAQLEAAVAGARAVHAQLQRELDAARAEVQRARYAEGEALRKVERLQVIKVVE